MKSEKFMAYFDGTANHLAFQLLKKTAQFQSLRASIVCSNADDSAVLRDRMLQALANWVLQKIRRNLFLRPEDTLIAEKYETWIDFSDGGAANFATGECRLGFSKERFTEYLRFLFIWTRTFFAIFNVFGKKTFEMGRKNALIYGVPKTYLEDQFGENKFEKFLMEISPSVIRKLDGWLVEFKQESKFQQSKNSHYVRFPEIAILSGSKLQFWQRLSLLKKHLGMFFTAHFILYKNPAASLIFSDFASLAVIRSLDNWKFISSIVITTTNTNKQQIWMRSNLNCELYYLHYASLPALVIDKNDPHPIEAEKELQFCFLADAFHWVWSQYDKRVLKERYGYQRCEVFGPPSFVTNSLQTNRSLPKNKDLNIVIFDVTPVPIEVENSHGVYYYYGNSETATAIIKDILDVSVEIAASNNLNLSISLKPKRKPTAIHDGAYVDFLDKEVNSRDYFKICSPDVDIRDIILPGCIAISRPFTSAALLAMMGGAKSFYYDPTMSIIDSCPSEEGLNLVQGRSALWAALSEHAESLQNKR